VFVAELQQRQTSQYIYIRAMKIPGSTFIITGGASGLGEATARILHSREANVVLFDINEERGKQISKELGNGRSLFVKVDVTSEGEIFSIFIKTMCFDS
jgi:NAD(P)-dependent dehydrogenase (short-subunit alcohol dehydrogenase family)